VPEIQMPSGHDVNRIVARAFGATLIVTGLAGFVIPPKKAMTSGAPAYNVFHLVFGALGIIASRRRTTARAFNVGFGAIDLYQAVASRRGWFPQKAFRWKTADDVLHVVIGAGLVAAGFSDPRPS
jgi:branched-subunit amino acid ABC-type transport system permease component